MMMPRETLLSFEAYVASLAQTPAVLKSDAPKDQAMRATAKPQRAR